MSVYPRPATGIWHYDFQLKGRRFHGSTGVRTGAAARKVEARLRLKAALGELGTDAAAYSLDEAAGRWWTEVGARRGDAAKLEGRVAALVALLGPTVRLREIDQTVVAEAIERRRGAPYRRSRKKDAKTYLRANATVNRDVVETLRPILKRAASHWGAAGLPAIDWRVLRLREPSELVRVYSEAEQAAWLAACDPVAALALDLMLTDGLRFGELFFPLAAYQSDGPRLAWMKGRKHDVPHTVPLLPRQAALIAPRIRRAAAAGLDHIWYDEQPPKPPATRPTLAPLTYWQLEHRLTAAADRAGIAGGRRIHGARHHAGTRMLRLTKGNLKAVQRLLGHADIASSARYAHLLDDELRAILESGEPAADDNKGTGT